MQIIKILNEIENLQKEKEIISYKALILIDDLKNETGVDLYNKTMEFKSIEIKLNTIKEKIKEKQKIIDETLEKNFDKTEIRIFVLHYYRNFTYSKISELLNYSEKQISRKYQKIINFKV